MASTFQISKKDAVNLMTDLGMDTAKDWNKDQMLKKIQSVPRMAAESKDKVESSPVLKSLVENITEALNDEAEIVLDGYEDKVSAPKGKKVKVKVKTKPSAAKEDAKIEKVKVKIKGDKVKSSKKTDKKEAPTGVPGKTKTTNFGEKPGVIAHMLDVLRSASKDKPVTRDQVLAKLVKKFPKRSEDSMRVTVVSQLPNRLRKRKGLKVMDNGKGGYWAKDVKEKTES